MQTTIGLILAPFYIWSYTYNLCSSCSTYFILFIKIVVISIITITIIIIIRITVFIDYCIYCIAYCSYKKNINILIIIFFVTFAVPSVVFLLPLYWNIASCWFLFTDELLILFPLATKCSRQNFSVIKLCDGGSYNMSIKTKP